MAAGDSPTSISNLALAMLGEDPIGSVDPPDNSKAGGLCGRLYHPSRRAMLEAAPWREAKKQFRAAAALTLPQFTYGLAYPVPDDFIRLYDLPEAGQMRWELMNLGKDVGLCIVTDAGPPADITYICDLIDTTQMSPLLVKAIAADMATWLALPLKQDMSLKTSCAADREAYLSLGRTVSAQQASPLQFDADTLLRSRF